MHITLQIKQPCYKIIESTSLLCIYCALSRASALLGVMAGSFKEQQASLFSSIVQAGRQQERDASSRSFMKRP